MQLMQKKNIIGLKIREARKKAHITQAKLAAQLQLMNINVDRVMVVKIEIGTRPVSDIEVAAISKILGVPIASFFEDTDEFFQQLEK